MQTMAWAAETPSFLANAISVASGVNVVLTATPGALPCAYPLPYSFTATGATATAWAYSIVNAAGVTLASGTTKNFTYSFQTPGTYLVTSIGSRSSCTSQDTLQLQISAQLTYAKFGTTIDSGCQPVTVHFLDSSFAAANQTITSRLWDFGDGTSSTLVNPTHTYAQVGQYTPQLTVTTSGGCSSTFSYARMVRVGTHPIADFGPRMDSACAPLAVQFSNQSTDTLAIGTKYFWDFGDGTHSTARDPKKTWNKPGRYTVKLYTSNNGCVDSSIAFRSFYVDSPMARFYALNPVGCDTPFTVFFRDSSISAHTWAWDFGDPASGANNTSTLRFPQHTYTQFGNYAVSLTVTNPNGCQHTALKQNYIHISDPHSRFSTADTGGCRPLSVAFNNTSTMGTYRWDFGDSTTSIQTAPTHVYANPGYYTVKLITRDVNGCFDTLVRPNYIHAVGPTAKFTPNGYVGCIAFYVNFTDNSFGYSAPIVRRHWQFGDPNSGALDTSNLLNPMHAYTVNGNYTVRLTVWDANGCSQTASRVNIIQVRNPIVRFTADTVRCLGLPVQFTAQPNNGIGWFWKFGDGTTDTGRTPQHAYTALGNYTVQLFVTNGLGCVDSLTKVAYVHVIQIHPRPYALPTVAVCAPKPIQFMDSTRYANAWQWDFGDGTGSTLQNPSHIYATNGWFNVKLKVWSLGGCEDSITVDSMVHLIGPRASYSFTQQGHCTIASVQFFNTSQDYTSCVWDFGDGSVSTSPNPVHQYNRSGTFNPVLIVYDATGCQASANPLPQIHVDTIPTAAFTVDVHTSCGPATVQFTDSSHNAVRYLWLFGDGTMDSASTNPVHTYFTGQFSPTLIVWNAAGCTDTLTLPGTVAVHTRPTAVFSADQPLGCPPHNVHFIDSSFATFGGHIVSWAWAFGDSASASLNASTQRNPNHTYNFPGKYTVRLIVHDDAGCTDTLTRIEYIVVKDSTPPQNTHITFVTVLNDAAVGLQWLPSQEPAFAAYALYRNDPTTGSTFTLLHTFTSRTDTAWVDLTTDVHHNSYCYYVSVIDICGKPSAPASNITHCSVLENATPAADPNLSGIDVKWTPYIGWTTLNRYRIYRKTQSQLVYTYIDSVPASQRTYTDAGMCPDTVAYKIVAVDTSSNLYLSLSNSAISPTSFHFNVAPISMLSATVVNGENRIFMHWPSMGGGKEILTYVVYRSPDGVNYIPNYATTPDTAFEDHDVDVNKEIWSYKVQAQDKCGHKTPLGEQGRNIRLTAEASGMDIRLSWTGYLEWKSGIDHYVVERLDPTTGLWDSLASTAPNMLMYFRPYDNSNLAQYKFRVTARQRGGAHQSSTSNYAEVVLPPTLFIPTAFTPNGNGLNEAFTIKGLHIAQYECEVYNRWGQSIFVTTDMDHPWDGMVAGQLAEQGVYAYRVYARGFNGFTETRYGTVSILR